MLTGFTKADVDKKYTGETDNYTLFWALTLMIAEGTDIRTVSGRLGHAQTSTTLNIYIHTLKSRDAVAADNLDNTLGTCVV